jgi:hypothetical protein
MHAPPIQRLIRHRQTTPLHHPHHPIPRMPFLSPIYQKTAPSNLFESRLLHSGKIPKPSLIVHFFLALMVKFEICVTKQRSGIK